jgi:hypothetical protein
MIDPPYIGPIVVFETIWPEKVELLDLLLFQNPNISFFHFHFLTSSFQCLLVASLKKGCPLAPEIFPPIHTSFLPPPHDSKPVWVATTSPHGTFIHCTMPVLIGAFVSNLDL